MNFNTVHPLAFTSALTVTTSLFYHQNLHYYEGLTATSMKVSENIEQLPVPQTVKDKIQGLVQTVGEEICSWVWEFRSILPRQLSFFKKFSWTPLGSMDHCKTAGNCISSGDIDTVLAFKLACASGNVEHILRLWPDVKQKMLKEMSRTHYVVGFASNSVSLWTTLWTAYLNNEMDEYRIANDDVYEVPFPGLDNHIWFICRKAVEKSNVGVLLFFIEEFAPDHKRRAVKELTSACISVHGRDFDTTMFLSLMYRIDEEDAKELLLKHQNELLLHFLKWPLQNFFLQYTEFLWPSFPYAFLPSVLERICAKVMQAQVPLVYENIFETFWAKIPSDKQREFFDRNFYYTLFNLFRPYTVEHVVKDLFKGTPDAYENFAKTIIEDASAVLSVLVEENKFKAFQSLLQKKFLPEKLTDELEEKYAKYTHSYVDEYYGIFNDSTTESSSESEIDLMLE